MKKKLSEDSNGCIMLESVWFPIKYYLYFNYEHIVSRFVPQACRLKKAEYDFVCTCDENYSDSLDVPQSNKGSGYTLVTSSEAGDRFLHVERNFTQDFQFEQLSTKEMS